MQVEAGNNAAPSDRWFVTNGVVAVGPVTFELVQRGLAYGRISTTSFVRHESWQVWRRLEELESLSALHRRKAIEDLANASAGVEERARSVLSEPPPPPSGEELSSRPVNLEPAQRKSFRPVSVDPVGVLSNAAELQEALLLTVSTAVAAASAEVGLVHRVRDDLNAAVTVGGHGPGTEFLLGERLAREDPTLLAARSGRTVASEPIPGDVGRYIIGRIARCVAEPTSVAMVPLLLYGELVAIFEIGRRGRPLRAHEVARVEDVVEALAERTVVMGWLG
ncbi:MAG TPA: hypothetical protein VJN18_23155 [Polyangiaceae bacterium]|nr:hypothetical protein [Polyangiaceae bacterium]